MTNRYLLSIFFTCCFISNCFLADAQFSGVKWEQKILVSEINRSAYAPVESFFKAKINNKKELFIIGRSMRDYGIETWGSSIRKIDSNGELVWQNGVGTYFFNAVPEAVFTDIIPAEDGGAYVLTVTNYYNVDLSELNGTDETKADIDLSRFSADGTLVWHKYFGGTRFDFPSSFILDRFGNIVIVGQTWSSNYDFQNKLRHVDTNSYAYKTWGSAGDTLGYLLPDSIRAIEIARYQKQNDAFIMKVSPSGQLLNLKCFGGSSTDLSKHILEHPVSGYVVFGYSESNDGELPAGGTGGRVWMLQFDTAFNIIENKMIDSATSPISSFLFVKDKKMYSSDSHGLREIGFDGGLVQKRSTNGLLLGENSFYDPTGFVFHPSGTAVHVYDSSFQFLDSMKFPGWQYGYQNIAVYGVNRQHLFLLSKQPEFEYTSERDINGLTSNFYSMGFLSFAQQFNICSGQIFMDYNQNNIKDSHETFLNGVKVEAKGQTSVMTVVSTTEGRYNIPLDTGLYQISISSTVPYYSLSPNMATAYFTMFDQTDTINFALQPVGSNNDLSINLLPLNTARPGFPVQYKLICTNQGTENISNVKVKFLQNPRVSFVSALPVVNSIVGDTLIWNVALLKPFDTAFINLNLKVAAPPTVNNTDTLLFKAFTYPISGDETPEDNKSILVQNVQGSYDPNDKTETHGGIITPEQLAGDEFLTYLIRFQNTGTDTAFTVMIRDTLTNKLDWSSLEMLSSSHPYQLYMIKPHILEFSFPNILLVDSNKNEPASHGFVAYRIKPKSNLAVGDTVLNRAHIYFDYNLPVKTNDQFTVLRNTLVTSVVDLNAVTTQLLLYPNPSNGKITIYRKGRISGNASLQITDMNGRVVHQSNFGQIATEHFNQSIDISNLSKGFYLISLRVGKEAYYCKFIIQ
jgi:hypothetical protein